MMKKPLILTFIFTLTLILVCGCSSSEPDDLAFYVVKREYINESMSDSEIVSAVKSNGRQMFDGTDIRGYNWQKHIVMLDPNAIGSLGSVSAQSGGSAIFKTDDTYAFALLLGNKLIYAGGFENGYANPDVPLQPYIKDKSRTSFTIEFNEKYANSPDKRTNEKLYNFLKDCGMLSSKTA